MHLIRLVVEGRVAQPGAVASRLELWCLCLGPIDPKGLTAESVRCYQRRRSDGGAE